ncbi:MAG: GNAT family N-acetyltransferase [Rubricoccaceae bacterium]|nr:GNAT family N-acetyltransferase [Rubricoccaceae bacterium]
MTENAHVLVTPRLRLRPLQARDGPALQRHWTDPAVRRFLWDDAVIPPHQVEAIVAESERLFADEGFGLWALQAHEETDLIGCGGYWYFHEPPQRELVLSLTPSRWGRGLATEAGHALLAYAFDRLGVCEVHASTDAPNSASLRLIDRLGFAPTHRAEAEGLDTVFFRLTASSYRTSPLRSA